MIPSISPFGKTKSIQEDKSGSLKTQPPGGPGSGEGASVLSLLEQIHTNSWSRCMAGRLEHMVFSIPVRKKGKKEYTFVGTGQ